ncbi:hypothetical protein [Pedobacter hiemivivus]|uniref:BZIP transcription factor n=1 Tax=Pedobacter hiemivivus TaxID=2530454 RepID=A0A4R0NEU6_9SPHI|nr:hypothetical protein [Pedobacter hiemivivus]TCC97702.1 hypothetical protein EZ444_07235 [Pedobacter hiemivivus]
MRHYYLLLILVFSSMAPFAQTNKFPPDGNVGIGTTTPSSQIEIYNIAPKITLTPASYPGNYKTSFGVQPGAQAFLIFGNNSQNEIRAGNSLAGGFLDFFTNNTVDQHLASDGNLAMRLAANGNVGIGTTSPREKLSVNGKIRAQEIKVEASPWPDYVFMKDYKLPTLQETEVHIKEKGHLPGIPSAAEVKANGIDLGEMNAKLLQKIEELTLHMIELTKQSKLQNEKYDKEIEYLKSKLK